MGQYKRFGSAIWILGILILLALGRDILANGRPLYCKIRGESYFPGLRTIFTDPKRQFGQPVIDSIRINNAWKSYQYEAAVFAPVPFSPGDFSDRPATTTAPPLTIHPGLPPRFKHWLGTDDTGRDIAAGIIGGARVALLTGFVAMLIALSLGVLIGAISGFFGDDRLRLYRSQALMLPTGISTAILYAFVARFYLLRGDDANREGFISLGLFTGILLIAAIISRTLRYFKFWQKQVVIPIDLIMMRITEVFTSIPKLILILSVAAITPGGHSIWFVITLIGILYWTDMAQLVRSELLRIRELEYVTAARGLGLTESRILLNHALPNAIRPAIIACAFGISSAIILEASLSFLGLGDEGLKGISWGSILFSARSTNLRFWWIAIPPGLMIFITVLAFTNLGEAFNDRRE